MSPLVTAYLSPSTYFPVCVAKSSLPIPMPYGRLLTGLTNRTPNDTANRLFSNEASWGHATPFQHVQQGFICPELKKAPFVVQTDPFVSIHNSNAHRLRCSVNRTLSNWVGHNESPEYFGGVEARPCIKHEYWFDDYSLQLDAPWLERMLVRGPKISVNYNQECSGGPYTDFFSYWNTYQEMYNGYKGASVENIMYPNVAPFFFLKWFGTPSLDDGSFIIDEMGLPGGRKRYGSCIDDCRREEGIHTYRPGHLFSFLTEGQDRSSHSLP